MAYETILLNGPDWEAQYFISEEQFTFWNSKGRNLENMLLDSPISSGFILGKECPGTLTGHVPGCDRSFLMENGLIPDPYFGRNLEQSAWSERASWAFRKTFTVANSWKGRRVILDFAGIDYEAMFFINCNYLGKHRGAFVPVSWDITDFVKFGEENLISLVFSPAPTGTPNHRENVPADFAWFHRTQIGFGWDWTRKFVPTGIWNDVTLISYDKVRLQAWNIKAEREQISLTMEIHSRGTEEKLKAEILLTSPDKTHTIRKTKMLDLVSGSNTKTVSFPVPDLQYWMPNGCGKASLYDLCVKLNGDTVLKKNIGFKDMSVVRNPDAPENAVPLSFRFNGKTVFINGVNWVPPNLMPSEVTEQDYEHLVALAANAGVNLFRMWGGGELEKECFYDLCDRYGIMVWHEFYHACTCTPKDDSAYQAFKEKEARSVLKRLRNHVSLSMICGGNEMQSYGETPESPVLQIYQRIAAELVPELPFNVTSPDNSRPGERYHGPWNFQEHSFYNTHFRYLASEYGCNAMPPFESLKKFVPKTEWGCMESQVLQYHFLNPSRLRRAYSFDIPLKNFTVENTEQFCNASMLAQADAVQYMTEHYRRIFPRSSGCIFWQYNEPWPTCSWSVVDHYGKPKAAVYSLKQAGQPVLLSLEDDNWCQKNGFLEGDWFCTVAKGFASGESVTASMEVWTGSGKKLFSKTAKLKLTEDTQLLCRIKTAIPAGEIIVVRMTIPHISCSTRLYGSPDFRSFFAHKNTATLKKRKDGSFQIANRGKNCALAVRLSELEGAPADKGFFTDDYLTLLPGESREVRFLSFR